ncbi:MAG: MoaD family protein [Candidatus Heimdallarchaeum aukensis]|uniref:MoaD family protein n=1 Tax=Candidatus Heimdallarchaeum aukensis TaxID=2876573 RepID=A0A9Y1BN39_9ARCH|nr:MAG: MoaD family protein [Candidatus Heimdallarchaeum aukensis]
MSSSLPSITVLFYSKIKQLIGQRKMDLNSDSIEDLLQKLFSLFGRSLFDELMLDEGVIKPQWRIVVNGRNINLLHGLSTKLKDGDLVAIVPAIAGG